MSGGGSKAAVALGTMMAVVLLGWALWWWWRQQHSKGELDTALLGETWEHTVRGRGVGKIHRRDAAAGVAALNSKTIYDGPMSAKIKFIPFAAAERAVGGKFEASQLIGVGGFGPVYRAHFPYSVLGLDPPVAGAGGGGGPVPSPSPRTAPGGDNGGFKNSPSSSSPLRSVFGSGGGRESGGGDGRAVPPEQRCDCAIKVLNSQGTQGIDQFVRELEVIAMCHHRNLLQLLGVVNEPNKPVCVITPFMGNQSLTHHLRDVRKRAKLPWVLRLDMAIDTCEALIYLHTPCDGKPRVIHRDIKPDNLLLDETMSVRLADFGLARELQSRVTHTGTAGTMFYIDPEYSETGELTEASDTYSYGVVLLQLLTGEARASDSAHRPPGLVARHRPKLRHCDEQVIDLADKHVKWKGQVCVTLGRIINSCVKRHGNQRPRLREVLNTLRDVKRIYGGTKENAFNTGKI